MNIEVYNSAIQDTWVYLLLNMIPILIIGIILIVTALVAFFKKIMQKPIIYRSHPHIRCNGVNLFHS